MTPHLDKPCMPWTGRVREDGYGTIGTKMAHRVAYMTHVGPIPAAYTIDHRCHTLDPTCTLGNACPHRRCVEPSHLEAVPHGTNVRRGRGRGSSVTGCPRGHEYTEANTLMSHGARHCKTCRADRQRARNAARVACRNGHPYDGTNARGYRTCSRCMSDAGKAAMASRWGTATTARREGRLSP